MLIVASSKNLGTFSLWIIVEAIERGCKNENKTLESCVGSLYFSKKRVIPVARCYREVE